MVEAVGPAQFSTINYVKDNEKISATKQGNTVTLVGDKNGTRQMPLEDFMKNELPNAKDIKLEKSPEQDTVELKAAKQVWTNPKDEIKNEAVDTAKESDVAKKLDVVA